LLKKGVTSRAQLRWKQARVHFDNAKAKNELKWTPTVSMEEGLNRTFEWYASQHR
jgi:nucleoside-diphosphate-sugar epimerase